MTNEKIIQTHKTKCPLCHKTIRETEKETQVPKEFLEIAKKMISKES